MILDFKFNDGKKETAMTTNPIYTMTGHNLDELTLDAVRSGQVQAEDFRISAETLHHQAEIAEQAGYRQLADNFRRAAELTRISNEEVLAMYNTLRSERTLAERLEQQFDAVRTAALVREAAEAYKDRGLVK